MIQRIQTVFLIIALIIFSLVFFFNFAEILVEKQYLYTFNIFGLSSENADIGLIVNTTPLIILSSVTSFTMVVAIFLFKKRAIQIRLININTFFLIGIYVMFGFYFYKLYSNLDIIVHYSFILIIPAISIVFNFLAKRNIKKDDELIKSVDRIR